MAVGGLAQLAAKPRRYECSMRKIVRAISVILFIYFIIATVGAVIGLLVSLKYLAGLNEYKIVFGYPLFLQTTITILAPVGLISSIGLYFYKNWGRYFANISLASIIILFFLSLFEKFFPNYFGYTLLESDGSFIFFHSSFNWEVIISAAFSLVALYFLNSSSFKKVLNS